MKIFISWSGDHARAIAQVVRNWIDDVFETATPFMSQSDIEGGSRPLPRIESELENARFGVIIVTKANQHAPWITFEAGALSKVIDDAGQYVMPMLVDLRISDLTGPLTQFQAAILDQAGTRKLVQSIGKVLSLEPGYVDRKFETYWPQLEAELKKIPAPVDHPGEKAERPSGDVLDEILTIVRALRADRQAPREAELRTGWARANSGEVRWRDDDLDQAVLVDERGAVVDRERSNAAREAVLRSRGAEVAAVLESYALSEGVRPDVVDFRLVGPRRVELVLAPGFDRMVEDRDTYLRGVTRALKHVVNVVGYTERRRSKPPHDVPQTPIPDDRKDGPADHSSPNSRT